MDAKSNTDIQSNHEQAEQRIRPFGIIDLIVVTTAMAVLFKLHGLHMSSRSSDSGPMWMLLVFGYAMSSGLALSALYWLPMQFSGTGKFFRQPGHWILGCFSIFSIGGVVFLVCFIIHGPSLDITDALLPAVGLLVWSVSYLCGAILATVAAFKVRGGWRVAMMFLIAFSISGMVAYAMGAIGILFSLNSMFDYVAMFQGGQQVVGFFAAITIGVAVCIGLVKKSQWDWLHWIGVVVAVVDLVLVPLLRFVSIYFMSKTL